jgi:hypothetical protein
MARSESGRRRELHRWLAHLDLYQHSLRLVWHKLVSEGPISSAALSRPLYERSLQLGEDCSTTLRHLKDRLDSEDIGECESTLRRVDLAVSRASQTSDPTLFVVNVWRVVETVEHFLGRVAVEYGYTALSDRRTLAEETAAKAGGAPFSSGFVRDAPVVVAPREAPRQASVAAWTGMPRWRARRLLSPGLLHFTTQGR